MMSRDLSLRESSACPSVRLSVTPCIVALRVGIQDEKLYQRVASRQLSRLLLYSNIIRTIDLTAHVSEQVCIG